MSDKAVVLGDCLLWPEATELANNNNIRVIVKSGATIENPTKFFLSIKHFLPNLWENMKFVWVLVGMNNIDNYLCACDYVRLYPFDLVDFIEEYRHMLLTISGQVCNIHIVIGGIILRLCEFEESKDMVNKVNTKLGKVCEKLHMEFCPVVKPFCFTGIPQEVFYRLNRLHVSNRGELVLKKAIQKCYSNFLHHN